MIVEFDCWYEWWTYQFTPYICTGWSKMNQLKWIVYIMLFNFMQLIRTECLYHRISINPDERVIFRTKHMHKRTWKILDCEASHSMHTSIQSWIFDFLYANKKTHTKIYGTRTRHHLTEKIINSYYFVFKQSISILTIGISIARRQWNILDIMRR